MEGETRPILCSFPWMWHWRSERQWCRPHGNEGSRLKALFQGGYVFCIWDTEGEREGRREQKREGGGGDRQEEIISGRDSRARVSAEESQLNPWSRDADGVGARHKPKCPSCPRICCSNKFPFCFSTFGWIFILCKQMFPKEHDMKEVRKAKNADVIPASFMLSLVLLTPGKLSLRTQA